jgi:hypothetical protein
LFLSSHSPCLVLIALTLRHSHHWGRTAPPGAAAGAWPEAGG